MITNEYSASVPTPMGDLQTDLPGIPRGSSLHEILAGYGLTPSEAPDGPRGYHRELLCGDPRAIAELWVIPGGDVDAFRIWSLRPRVVSAKNAV